MLLEAGADPNARDDHAQTPLTFRGVRSNNPAGKGRLARQPGRKQGSRFGGGATMAGPPRVITVCATLDSPL
jgi:hypothetical protein